MARISHVQRRGAVYHYRRRLPRNLAERLGQSHFVLSLRTKEHREARRLAARLDAEAAPCFTGCLCWERPTQQGNKIYHRELYWLPLLLFYGGARREEFAGLLVTDVREEKGIPLLDISPNKYRRLKNAQSARKIPARETCLRKKPRLHRGFCLSDIECVFNSTWKQFRRPAR